MLKTKHFFPFVRMVRALDAKEVLQELLCLQKKAQKKVQQKAEDAKTGKGKAVENIIDEVGVDVIALLIDKLPNAEEEVFNFLSIYTGKPREDIESQDITETFNLLKQIFAESNFVSFFQQAAK